MGSSTKEQKLVAGDENEIDRFFGGTPESTTRTHVDNSSKIGELVNQIQFANPEDKVKLSDEVRRLVEEQKNTAGRTTTKARKVGEIENQYNAIKGLVDAGPGQSDVAAGADSVRSLADMLKQYTQTGGLPGQEDINQANSFARSLFGSQQEQLNQSFGDQYTEANRRSAIMGRSMNDPILAAKLGIEQTRQQRTLDSQRGGWATQFAMQQPDRRLGYATDRTNALQGLATQAMANRQALLSMGTGIQSNERNWRLNTGTQTQTTTPGLMDWVSLGLTTAKEAGKAAMSAAGGAPGAGGGSGGGGGWNPSGGASNGFSDSQMSDYMTNRFGGRR